MSKIINLYPQSKRNEYNIVTAGMASVKDGGDNYIIDKDGEYFFLPLAYYEKVGDKLSVINDAIVIGKGVNYVKISGMVHYQIVASQSAKWCTIQHFDSQDEWIANEICVPINATNRCSVVSSTRLLKVQEGDKFKLSVYAMKGDAVREDIAYTNITVEVVE